MDLSSENEALRRRNAELEAALRTIADTAAEKVRLHTRGRKRYGDPDAILGGVNARQNSPPHARGRNRSRVSV